MPNDAHIARAEAAPKPNNPATCLHLHKAATSRSDLGGYVYCLDCRKVTWSER